MDFSRAACLDTTAIGKSTSASRLHSLGIILRFRFSPVGQDRAVATAKIWRRLELAACTLGLAKVDLCHESQNRSTLGCLHYPICKVVRRLFSHTRPRSLLQAYRASEDHGHQFHKQLP